MMVASQGIIIVERNRMKKKFLNLKSINAKAYAARLAMIRCEIITVEDWTKLLNK
jgi:hypothetical protein